MDEKRMDKVVEEIGDYLSREDGRPEAYEVPPVAPGRGYVCAMCAAEGHMTPHPSGKAAMISPIHTPDAEPHFLCTDKHLPRNVVIYDPVTNKCRDLDGNVWEEGAPLLEDPTKGPLITDPNKLN